MAMKLIALTAILLALAGVSCSKVPLVILYNNSQTDLTVSLEPNTEIAFIEPGKSAEIHFRETLWIDFGMSALRYEFNGLELAGLAKKGKVKIQAENDGRLYLVLPETPFPVTIFPKQPVGFPRAPVEKVDLT